MNPRIEPSELMFIKEKQIKIPPAVQQIIDSLRNELQVLEDHQCKLNNEVEKKSVYYSVDKLFERVKKIAIAAEEKRTNYLSYLTQELQKQIDFFKQEADKIESLFTRYAELHNSLRVPSKALVDAIRRAGVEYCNHSNDFLLVKIKRITSPAALLLARKIFSDYVEIDFNEEGEFACVPYKGVENDTLLSTSNLFNRRMKAIHEEWVKLGSPAETAKEVETALTYIEREMTRVANSVRGIELNFRFSKNGFGSSILIAKKVHELEARRTILFNECEVSIASCVPIDKPDAKVEYDVNPFMKQKKSAVELVKKVSSLTRVMSYAHDELESESELELNKVAEEVVGFKEKLAAVCQKLVGAITDLKRKIEDDDINVSYPAYLHLKIMLADIHQISIRNQKGAMLNKLSDIERRYGAKIVAMKMMDHQEIFSACELWVRKSLAEATSFSEAKQREILLLEREQLARELVDVVTQALLANLGFWNKQIGVSNYKIGNIKVPNGIAEMITKLANGQAPLRLLKEMKNVAMNRLGAGPKRFFFFKVRAGSTGIFYNAFNRLVNIDELNEAQFEAFKRDVDSVIDKRQNKLKFAAPLVDVDQSEAKPMIFKL